MQAQQLSEKAQKLDDKDAVLQRGLQILENENAQLAAAQLTVQSAAATNKQLSADLADEQSALAKQLKSLHAREADLENKLHDCDRTIQVKFDLAYCALYGYSAPVTQDSPESICYCSVTSCRFICVSQAFNVSAEPW